MNKAIGLALLAVGIALIIYGVDASHSAASHLSNTFTGSPTNKTMWLLIGGIAAAVFGVVLTLVPSHRR
jgi:divalent metal cation (Fe/Co/Zn/Cd) transporter